MISWMRILKSGGPIIVLVKCNWIQKVRICPCLDVHQFLFSRFEAFHPGSAQFTEMSTQLPKIWNKKDGVLFKHEGCRTRTTEAH